MIKLQKISRKQIINFTDADYQISLQDDELSEMAIPSYLHPLPLVRWLMWRRYETIASWLELGSDSRVLEFGCGTGVFLPTLCSNTSTVFALDLAPGIARKLCLENRLPVNFIEELDRSKIRLSMW
ncbi:MAG: class I SAM-dependent methyltransferase [Anaerolineaceae bacterium]